ncbi:unnamed protein product [Chrysodeixis includens]|uniref:Uncharacterized protein n=1 Tax=Chrysodeixis includens TaxID=689277 RepID=A0A9N8KRH9_CHRIL|nr:unnamed protein product [Chrysodeixis includens]
MVAGKQPTIAFPKRVSVGQTADYKTIAKTLSNMSRRRVAPTPTVSYLPAALCRLTKVGTTASRLDPAADSAWEQDPGDHTICLSEETASLAHTCAAVSPRGGFECTLQRRNIARQSAPSCRPRRPCREARRRRTSDIAKKVFVRYTKLFLDFPFNSHIVELEQSVSNPANAESDLLKPEFGILRNGFSLGPRRARTFVKC